MATNDWPLWAAAAATLAVGISFTFFAQAITRWSIRKHERKPTLVGSWVLPTMRMWWFPLHYRMGGAIFLLVSGLLFYGALKA